MIGFNIAEGGHPVNILSPKSISGGATAQAFSMKNAAHVSIIIQIGAVGAAMPTSIVLNACTAVAGTGATAMPFRYYLVSAAGNSVDTTNAPVYAPAAGILQAALTLSAGQFIIIELDASELDYLGDGDNVDFPYLQLVIADSGNTTFMSAFAVQSGVRQAYRGGQTATV